MSTTAGSQCSRCPSRPGATTSEGRGDAPVTMVEYGDYECPFCGMAYPVMEEMHRAPRRRAAVRLRHFPLTTIHPHAARLLKPPRRPAAQGRFWEMHGLLYATSDAWTTPTSRARWELGSTSSASSPNCAAKAHARRSRRTS